MTIRVVRHMLIRLGTLKADPVKLKNNSFSGTSNEILPSTDLIESDLLFKTR